MYHEEQQHLQALRLAYAKRLRVLELREAHHGPNTPADVVIEIEDLRDKIAEMDEQLSSIKAAKECVSTAVEDRPHSDPVKQILARSSIRLLHLKAPVEPPVIETHERVVTIGRAPKNMVILAYPEVSWEHGHIILRQDGYIYHHLSTSNPTIIRRKHEEYLLRPGKNEEVILRNQDRLIIGPSMFVVEFSLINEDVGYTTTHKKPEDADDQ